MLEAIKAEQNTRLYGQIFFSQISIQKYKKIEMIGNILFDFLLRMQI